MKAARRRKNPLIRYALIAAGLFLIALTPIVGPIPGPGGVFVFAGGLVLILRNSEWARKRFARFKRRWPRFGHYADMALRRRSFRRRQARAKEMALAAAEAEAMGFGGPPR
ncbi:hypothetical protein OF829_19350 [Sphingomonas sp. LB-2]|uniref:hypothetical protein n=1 Tax=Sphingomonas caeni TaxID=2984949 RepID=UPI00222E77AA|nr:hypothetical protein [Sphingomonas caeni]MCW3849402.1 hypothetical protein [Sphingomonas caeni]